MSETEHTGLATHGSILQMKKMLINVDGWFDKTITFAKMKSFDPAILLQTRLAPDQMPLVRQIQSACDRAKFLAARLSGKEAPPHPDTERTLDEIRARIRTCVSYLHSFRSEDFEESSSRIVELPFFDDKTMRGDDYLRELGQPGFYFHVVTAYAILRHSGVDLTMRDFVGVPSLRERVS